MPDVLPQGVHVCRSDHAKAYAVVLRLQPGPERLLRRVCVVPETGLETCHPADEFVPRVWKVFEGVKEGGNGVLHEGILAFFRPGFVGDEVWERLDGQPALLADTATGELESLFELPDRFEGPVEVFEHQRAPALVVVGVQLVFVKSHVPSAETLVEDFECQSLQIHANVDNEPVYERESIWTGLSRELAPPPPPPRGPFGPWWRRVGLGLGWRWSQGRVNVHFLIGKVEVKSKEQSCLQMFEIEIIKMRWLC